MRFLYMRRPKDVRWVTYIRFVSRISRDLARDITVRHDSCRGVCGRGIDAVVDGERLHAWVLRHRARQNSPPDSFFPALYTLASISDPLACT